MIYSRVSLLIIAEKYNLKESMNRSIYLKAIAQRIRTSISAEATIRRRSHLTKLTVTYVQYRDDIKES